MHCSVCVCVCVCTHPVSMVFVNAAQETLHAENTGGISGTLPSNTETDGLPDCFHMGTGRWVFGKVGGRRRGLVYCPCLEKFEFVLIQTCHKKNGAKVIVLLSP